MADIGLVGLGVMGSNLALNMAEKGYTVAVHNRTTSKIDTFMANAGKLAERLVPCKTVEELAAAVEPPRPIVIMVLAGAAGRRGSRQDRQGPRQGRSADRRRQRQFPRHAAAREGRSPPGASISSASASPAARKAPATDPRSWSAAPKHAWKRVEKILLDISAKFEGEPCAALMGPDGAGHFVKTIHNGIEYADMQMIAEVYGVMRDGLGMRPAEMADVFGKWNEGRLKSYLIEITGKVLEAKDPETGKPMVEIILDKAGQKGTGRWSAIEAQEIGVPATVIEAAVAARGLSAQRDFRLAGEKLFGKADTKLGAAAGDRAGDPRCARAGAARRQDRRLRAGLRRALRRLRDVELEPAAGHHRQDLARRLHHPLGLPRRHLARPIRPAATIANLMMVEPFAGCSRQSHGHLRHVVSAALPKGMPDAGAVERARLFRLCPHRPHHRQPAAGPARLLRRPRLRAHRQGRQGLPRPLGHGAGVRLEAGFSARRQVRHLSAHIGGSGRMVLADARDDIPASNRRLGIGIVANGRSRPQGGGKR